MTVFHLSSRHSAAADVASGNGLDWQAGAACRDEDPELFHPVGHSGPAVLQAMEAKAVCRRCPVMDACNQWNVQAGTKFGVWGGTSEDDRRRTSRRGRRDRDQTNLNAGRDLAVKRGCEVILARLAGQTDSQIAKWAGVGLFPVQHALRILLPQTGQMRASLTPLERVLIHNSEAIAIAVRAESTDFQIGRLLGYAPHTIAAARAVLAHREAAKTAHQMGLAA